MHAAEGARGKARAIDDQGGGETRVVRGCGGGDVGEFGAGEDDAGGEAAGFQPGEVEGCVNADGGEGCAGAVALWEFIWAEGAELEMSGRRGDLVFLLCVGGDFGGGRGLHLGRCL